MVPKSHGFSDPSDSLQQRTDDLAHKEHPLVILSKHIHWKGFDKSFASQFHLEKGRPGHLTRLMLGLHYLKHIYNLSDEKLLLFYPENPQWQYFCGQEYYKDTLPCDQNSLSRWRKRIGQKNLNLMLEEIINVARRLKLLKCPKQRPIRNTPTKKKISQTQWNKKQAKQPIMRNTITQKKSLASPTNSRLYFKVLRSLKDFYSRKLR